MDKNSLQFQLYKLDDDNKIKALVIDDSIWLTQKLMSELFSVDRTSIARHLKNIFDDELEEKVVCAEIALTTHHGAMSNKTQTKDIKIYNLDAIISVGYRVNSLKATRFRQWATKILREYMIKGFVMDVWITGQTAAEIIYDRVDKDKDNMGSTARVNSPDGRILKSDVSVAKNYLSEQEIRRLERSVSGV